MPNIATLVPETKSSTLPLELGDLEVTYKPRLLQAIQERQEPDEGDADQVRSRLAEDICRVLDAWDLEGRVPLEDMPGRLAGSVHASGPIPLDPDVVKYLPQPLLTEITMAVVADAQPDPEALGKRSRTRGRNGTSSRQN